MSLRWAFLNWLVWRVFSFPNHTWIRFCMQIISSTLKFQTATLPPPAIGRLGHYPTNTTIWPDVCLSLLLRYCLFLFPSVCAVKGICFVRPTVLLNFKLWCSNALLLYHFTRSGTIQWNLLTCILTGKVKQLNSRLLKNTKSKHMRPGMSHA